MKCLTFVIIFAAFVILIGILIGVLYVPSDKKASVMKLKNPPFFKNVGIVTKSSECSNIGLYISHLDGTAADIAIATLLCEGVLNPHSMGIGGGFTMVIYDHKVGKVEVLNAQEEQPGVHTNIKSPNTNREEGITVGVPGELKGYWELHRRYGKVPWYLIFKPTIKLCVEGFNVSKDLAKALSDNHDRIMDSPTLKIMFTNPKTGGLYEKGDLMKNYRLSEFLSFVAHHNPDVLYNGLFSNDFIFDIKARGGIVSRKDLKDYCVNWQFPVYKNLGEDYEIYLAPPPASGPVLLLALKLLMRLPFTENPSENWFKIIEAWKFSFGYKTTLHYSEDDRYFHMLNVSTVDGILDKIKNMRLTTMNQGKFYEALFKSGNTKSGGTGHVCVYGPDGDAISVTSSLNTNFGAFFASSTTGIILNNYLAQAKPDVETDNTTKQIPISNVSPAIILDRKTKTVKMVVGGSGGSQIVTAMSSVIMQYLFYNVTLEEAIKRPRLHSEFEFMVLKYEHGFSDDILRKLINYGHRPFPEDGTSSHYFLKHPSAVYAIAREGDYLYGFDDPRKNGSVEGY